MALFQALSLDTDPIIPTETEGAVAHFQANGAHLDRHFEPIHLLYAGLLSRDVPRDGAYRLLFLLISSTGKELREF